MDLSGLPAALRGHVGSFSWKQLLGVVSAGLVGKILWNHYGILRHRRLVPHDLGPPLIGHTLSIFRESLEGWAERVLKGKKVLLLNYLFQHAVIICDYSLYLKYIHRAELDGELICTMPPSFKPVLGEHSIILMPGGKGHTKHKRMRNKILGSLGPRNTLKLVPEYIGLVRKTCDLMAEETKKNGFATFYPIARNLASQASMLPVTSGANEEQQAAFERIFAAMLAGLLSVPINLGSLTVHGRAILAKKELSEIISSMLANPPPGQNLVKELALANEDGESFNLDEVVDSVGTLLAAGQLTTADALPWLLGCLAKYPEWREKIAKEPLEFNSVEEDSATLRFVRETLRTKPPAGAYRRSCPDRDLDLGEHGVIPAGVCMAIFLARALEEMGAPAASRRMHRRSHHLPVSLVTQFLLTGGGILFAHPVSSLPHREGLPSS
eukprot:TRINITY_DN21249_c0_g3_i4.p1 TRINITY_DN21249_c0_g3~~TRINITY_DN21249_c0_g3_i4.p1  ORF type:complete len:439 (+),score=90.86 TRINITY_DN21249_c0_g3_i4:124-1440(+)